MKVRETLPQRRSRPTKIPNGRQWSQHKPDLKEDFHNHCGYCGSYDGFRLTYFEVDHFIPKAFFEPLGNISVTEYSNLVYSCKFCNNFKSSKWPSQSEAIFHINDEGFLDPCDEEFDNHLYRTNSGSIMWKTPLGKWMVTKSFKFDERERSIIVLWNLNELRKVIDKFIERLNKENKNSVIYKSIKAKASIYSFEYYKYHKQLIEYYNG